MILDRLRRRRCTRVFASIAAQADNIGDILIRKTLLEGFDSSELVVYVGKMPKNYVDCFQLKNTAEISKSGLGWQLRYLWSAARGPVILVFAPGPQGLSDDRGTLAKLLVNVVNVLLCRFSGGKSVICGRSYVGDSKWATVLTRFIVRSSAKATVRDIDSAGNLGMAIDFVPDFAFAHVGAPNLGAITRVRRVGISLRGDRPPPVARVAELLTQLADLKFDVQFVTQVARDSKLHEELGRRFDVPVLGWTENVGHLDQLIAVESALAQCEAIISNRLHSLILGSTLGAIPIGFGYGHRRKLLGCLEPVFSEFVVLDDGYELLPAALSPNRRPRFLHEAGLSRLTVLDHLREVQSLQEGRVVISQ